MVQNGVPNEQPNEVGVGCNLLNYKGKGNNETGIADRPCKDFAEEEGKEWWKCWDSSFCTPGMDCTPNYQTCGSDVICMVPDYDPSTGNSASIASHINVYSVLFSFLINFA